MKKILSLLLALTIILSMTLVASAGGVSPSKPITDCTISKTYIVTGADSSVFPRETLTFTVTKDSNNPDDTMIVVGENNSHTIDANSDDIPVTIPSYSVPGKYNYTIKENAGNTQGVGYNTTVAIGVQVLVTYNADHTGLNAQAVFSIKADDGTKIKDIPNTYRVGALSVKKEIKGNLASITDIFEITVAFTSDKPVMSDISYSGAKEGTIAHTAWTKSGNVYTYSQTLEYKAEDTVIFANIPEGVAYVVTEADYSGDINETGKGYETSYDNSKEGTIAADKTASTIVTNTKETTVDTGIILDSIPYFLMLAVALAGVVLVIRKKNYEA